MSNDNLLALAKYLLPEVLVDYFSLTNHEIMSEELHFYFSENNVIPIEHSDKILMSKGFHSESTVQDFPIRGKQVYLHIKRRRLIEKETRQIITRDWDIVAKGTRMTDDFATFLKEIHR